MIPLKKHSLLDYLQKNKCAQTLASTVATTSICGITRMNFLHLTDETSVLTIYHCFTAQQ